MSEFGIEVIHAARARVGQPFRHHYKLEDLCDHGRITRDACMEHGMDPAGYDCSGLVIASLCDVLGISPSAWPRKYRHARQLKNLAIDAEPQTGDVILFRPEDIVNPHMGILVAPQHLIHASGLGYVDEQDISDVGVVVTKTLPSHVLVGLKFASYSSKA